MKSARRYQIAGMVAVLAASAIATLAGSSAQSNEVSVSIVSGSSSLTTNAFQPNPVEIGVGETVVWTNDDSQPHTVTSGSGATPDGQFDSSPNFNPLMNPGDTFSHTFEQAGEYPYYCALHPNMAGTVVVSGGESPPAGASPQAAGKNASSQAANMTFDQARQLYLEAWNSTEFNATFSAFIEENSALGYGVYQNHSTGNVFSPGETIVLYVEPVGYSHLPVTDDDGNSMYAMNMTADYVISDSQGNELARIPDVPVGNIVSHRQNTELFLELTLTQDSPFPEGDYVITYIIHDNVSGESFEMTKNVRIAQTPAPKQQG